MSKGKEEDISMMLFCDIVTMRACTLHLQGGLVGQKQSGPTNKLWWRKDELAENTDTVASIVDKCHMNNQSLNFMTIVFPIFSSEYSVSKISTVEKNEDRTSLLTVMVADIIHVDT